MVSCPHIENRSGLRTDGSKGRGSGIVIATGAETEFGVIFSMMQDVRALFLQSKWQLLMIYLQVEERRTPLQLNMDELAKKLSFASFGVIGVICLIGVLQSRSWLEMFTIGGTYLREKCLHWMYAQIFFSFARGCCYP